MLTSLVLPGVVAGVVCLALISLLLAPAPGWQIALTRLLQVLLTGPMTESQGLIFGGGLLETTAVAVLLFESAVQIFERRDLRLKSE